LTAAPQANLDETANYPAVSAAVATSAAFGLHVAATFYFRTPFW
jgi:hypothetical protein